MSTNQTHDIGHEIEMILYIRKQKQYCKKIYSKTNALKKDRSRLGLIFHIYYPSQKTGVTSIKTNPKNKETRFLNKQLLRDEMEKKKSIKKLCKIYIKK
jgi:hypothetical protein